MDREERRGDGRTDGSCLMGHRKLNSLNIECRYDGGWVDDGLSTAMPPLQDSMESPPLES